MKKIVAACVATAVAVGFVLGTGLRQSAEAGSKIPAFDADIYTANFDASTVSALGGPNLDRASSDVSVGSQPTAVALSHDGSLVYTGNRGGADGTISVFNTANNAGVQTFTVAAGGDVSDIVVAPDDSLVYATIRDQGAVKVFDTTTHAVVNTFALPTVSSNSPSPDAIDVTPDGQVLYVLNTLDHRVEKLAADDGENLGHIDVSSTAFGLKLSKNGAVVIVLGAGAPQFFQTVNLQPVAGANSVDHGSPVDAACAGTQVFVLNSSYDLVGDTATPPGGFNPVNGNPSIDVYDALTGAYVHSMDLGGGSTVLGIAVTADATTGYFTRRGAESVGSATSVELGTGILGPTGQTGSNPVAVAVNEGVATPVISFFLPKVVSLSLKGAGKDSLKAAGFYDDGGVAVDYTDPVSVNVGGYQQTFTLVPNAKGTAYKYVSPDKTLSFLITPNLKGSSLGKFVLKIVKSTLSDKINTSQPVEFHFHATGLQDAQGEVLLTSNKYRLGGRRGALTLPPFFPAKALAKLSGPNQDSLSFKGGFATNGVPTPDVLSTVRFSLGPTYARTIPGGLFTKKGDVFKYSDTVGSAKFTITLNFLRELVLVKATKIEIGDLAGQTVDVVLDAGNGSGAFRNTVRLGTKGSKKAY